MRLPGITDCTDLVDTIEKYEGTDKRNQCETPLALLDSVYYVEDGTPIEYYHTVHRGDRSRFEIELVRMRDQKELQEAIESKGIKLPNSN